MDILYLWNIQLTSKPAGQEKNTAHLQNLLVISNPSVLKILKLVMLLCSYERFSTGKVNANRLQFIVLLKQFLYTNRRESGVRSTYNFCTNVQASAEMETFVCLMAVLQQDVWKCAMITLGAQCVMMNGIIMMQLWCADSLDCQTQVSGEHNK